LGLDAVRSNLAGQDIGLGEVFTVFEALVFEPEDIEVQLVALG
jgi:hypothetical protein